MTAAATVLPEAASPDARAPAHQARRPRKRRRAFLRSLARQPMPVVLVDADEVALGCDLARRGYVHAGHAGSAQQPALIVCALTPWGLRSAACKP